MNMTTPATARPDGGAPYRRGQPPLRAVPARQPTERDRQRRFFETFLRATTNLSGVLGRRQVLAAQRFRDGGRAGAGFRSRTCRRRWPPAAQRLRDGGAGRPVPVALLAEPAHRRRPVRSKSVARLLDRHGGMRAAGVENGRVSSPRTWR